MVSLFGGLIYQCKDKTDDGVMCGDNSKTQALGSILLSPLGGID